jgi:hypothetical protein
MPKTLLLLAALALSAHPLHTTHTEVVDIGGGRVTITVRSFTDDLHSALGKAARTSEDSALARYLRETVRVCDRTGRAAPLVFDSARVEGDITLLTLHAVLPGGLRGASLRQTMQMELYDDQVNVVQSRYDGRAVSLLFLPGDGARTLP